MRRHAVEALAAAAAALLVTAIIAAPVVRAPSERIFGAEIVGRHHDPFTVMQQFARPMSLGVYSQRVTDFTGAAMARVAGAVAAYNWLVLLSFPLSSAAAYLLARHLALPPAGALLERCRARRGRNLWLARECGSWGQPQITAHPERVEG